MLISFNTTVATPPEMVRALFSAQVFSDLFHPDEGGKSVRVQVGDFGVKHQVDPLPVANLHVHRDRLGVSLIILFGSELQRIHEDADDNPVGDFPGFTDQAEVSFVQRAHGGNQDDPSPRVPVPAALLAGPADLPNDLHNPLSKPHTNLPPAIRKPRRSPSRKETSPSEYRR